MQAAIAALHDEAPSEEATDWHQIVVLYSLLQRIAPSPVVALNLGVAVGMAEGPAQGLRVLDTIVARGELAGFHLLHAARASFLARLGHREDAAQAYRMSLCLVTNDTERAFLEARLQELKGN